jgi:L-ascorbate metabolism protein UlaG (beta-lactamase superfamily)
MTSDSAGRRAQLTPLGHSCVLIEILGAEAPGYRLVLDPGNLTPPLTGLGHIDAILITHAHPDHIDPAQISAIREAGDTTVYGPADAIAILRDAGFQDGNVLEPGTFGLGPLHIGVWALQHEVIYPGVPLPGNLGFDIDRFVFAPGDSFAAPPHPVNLLLAPVGAPWMKLAETIDYMREVCPRRVVPVHDGGLGPPHRVMHRNLMVKFAPPGTDVHILDIGESVQLFADMDP